MKQVNTGYEVRAPTRQRVTWHTRNRRRDTAVFLYPKPKIQKNNNFYSRKAAESEENICHFLLRQLVYFKPL